MSEFYGAKSVQEDAGDYSGGGGDPQVFDAVTPRDYKDAGGTERTAFTRVGVAFALSRGKGYKIELDGLPTSGKLLLFPKRPVERSA